MRIYRLKTRHPSPKLEIKTMTKYRITITITTPSAVDEGSVLDSVLDNRDEITANLDAYGVEEAEIGDDDVTVEEVDGD